MIFGESILGCEVAKILPRHSTRRRAARASRNEGVHFEPYQGRRGQDVVVPCVMTYQIQTVV